MASPRFFLRPRIRHLDAAASKCARMINVAIVGLGNIGNIHAGVYRKLKDDVQLVAVCDIIKEKADKAAEKYGAKAFYSVAEMLKSGIKIDACSVATAG